MRRALPRVFLEAAAPGYLTDIEWDLQPSDWLEQRLGYTKRPAKGVGGPLAPFRPHVFWPASTTGRSGSWPTTSTSTAAAPAIGAVSIEYQVAMIGDELEESAGWTTVGIARVVTQEQARTIAAATGG
jgi:hypothetical protein